MRVTACLACLLLLLLAAPCLSAVSARAQGATDMAPAADDDEEEVGSDKAEREDPAALRAAGGDPLGIVRRADAAGLDWDEDSRPRAPHPAQLAHPDHDVVVCEAGCDGSPGSIVYLKKRERRTE